MEEEAALVVACSLDFGSGFTAAAYVNPVTNARHILHQAKIPTVALIDTLAGPDSQPFIRCIEFGDQARRSRRDGVAGRFRLYDRFKMALYDSHATIIPVCLPILLLSFACF